MLCVRLAKRPFTLPHSRSPSPFPTPPSALRDLLLLLYALCVLCVKVPIHPSLQPILPSSLSPRKSPYADIPLFTHITLFTLLQKTSKVKPFAFSFFPTL